MVRPNADLIKPSGKVTVKIQTQQPINAVSKYTIKHCLNNLAFIIICKVIIISILYLHFLWLSDVTHIGSWLQWLKWLKVTIRLRNLNVWWHVRVWPWERCRFYAVRWQRLLQLLSLDSFHPVVVFSSLVS